VQMAPHALPDPFAIAIFIATVIALLTWRIDAIKLMIAGSVLGVLLSRILFASRSKDSSSYQSWSDGLK